MIVLLSFRSRHGIALTELLLLRVCGYISSFTCCTVLYCIVLYCCIAGICRRIAMATMSLLHQSGSASSVEQINNMFHVISVRWPTLMVQWSNILILLNYGNKACWSELLRTPETFSVSVSRSAFIVFHIEFMLLKTI